MSMTATVYGRLSQDPKPISTKTGKAMATASIALSLDRQDKAHTTWLNVVAFGDHADDLLLHSKGDSLNVSGPLQTKKWTGKDGKEHEQLSVVCDVITSARTERAHGGRAGARGGRRDGAGQRDIDYDSYPESGEERYSKHDF